MSDYSEAEAPSITPAQLARLRNNPAFTAADHLIIDRLAAGELSLAVAGTLLGENLQADAAAALATARQHEVLNDEDRLILDRISTGELTAIQGEAELKASWQRANQA